MKPITFMGLFSALVFCALLFGLLERVFRVYVLKPKLRKERIADLLFWFFTPTVTRWMVVTSLSALTLAIAGKDVFAFAETMQQRGPLAGLPGWLQIVIALLCGDFLMYWNHRLFHRGWFWKVHAVHHSPEELDWLVSARIHPLNDLPNKLVTVLPMLFLGVDLKLFAVVIPFMQLWTVSLHANLPFGFGPLAYVITTPRYHRWHHTSAPEGIDKNFAGLFPIWDIVFGTFYLPKGVQPHSFGAGGDVVPTGFVGQLLHPFGVRFRASQNPQQSVGR